MQRVREDTRPLTTDLCYSSGRNVYDISKVYIMADRKDSNSMYIEDVYR
jgi:hypothetical protein